MAEITQIDLGLVVGDTGATGATGPTGPQGPGATISVGSVTTTTYGNPAQVTNSGTATDAVLDFVIPQGAPGEEVTDVSSLTLNSITETAASFPVPAVGDVMSVVMGKVKKFFADTVAALNTKLNKENVVNDLTYTAEGYALDARAGKTLKTSIDSLNDSFTSSQRRLTESLTSDVVTVRADSFVYKKAGILLFQLNISVTTAVAQWDKIASFPNGFEPANTVFGFLVAGGSQGSVVRIYATREGIYTAAPLTANTIYIGSIVAMT